ncbi:MAG: hypothetical protein ACLFUR_06205 [Candidatus Hadarchaeia archaeon]
MEEDERKGQLKVTIDLEVNEDMLNILEKTIEEVPEKISKNLKEK